MPNTTEQLDLVDEMQWEDCEKIDVISIEEAQLEETITFDERYSSIYTYLDWFHDGEQSEFDRE